MDDDGFHITGCDLEYIERIFVRGKRTRKTVLGLEIVLKGMIDRNGRTRTEIKMAYISTVFDQSS